MEKFDVRRMTEGVDAALAVTTDPHQRAILKNYRRHGLLEVSGRWQEILVPEMIVDHPWYRIMFHDRTEIYDGMDAVAEMYRSYAESGATVFGPVGERVMVADWGFSSESTFHFFFPGAMVREMGLPAAAAVDDPDGLYTVAVPCAMVWPYTPDARRIGEHVYQDWRAAEVFPADPADMVTTAQAAELLAPLLENEPQ